MLKIRQANKNDTDNIIKLYHKLIDQVKNNKSNPEWIKGVYPKEEYLKKLIEDNEVYVGEKESHIVSSIVINHVSNEGYDDIKWNVNAGDDEVYYIHLVAVNQEYKKQGIAKKMLNYAFDLARKNSIKSIRLNLNVNNLSIENLYKQFDFKLIDTIKVEIEDRGFKTFNVYEKTM